MAQDQSALDVLRVLIGIAAMFIVLNTLFLGLRFISRTVIQRVKIGVDDILMYPGYVLNIGLCATAIVVAHIQSRGNYPAHEVFNQPSQLQSIIEPSSKIAYAEVPLLYFGGLFPKVSLLTTYLRVFPGKWTRITIYSVMAAIVILHVTLTFIFMFGCHPIRLFWDPFITGHCINLQPAYNISSPIIFAFDIVIILIPLRPLWSLKAPRSKKVGLICVFMTGGLGALGCVARWVAQDKYQELVFIPYNTAIVWSCVIVEPSFYFIAACLPPCSSILMLLIRNPQARRMLCMGSMDTYDTEPDAAADAPGSEHGRHTHRSSRFSSRFSRGTHTTSRARDGAPSETDTGDTFLLSDTKTASSSYGGTPVELDERNATLADAESIHMRRDVYVTRSHSSEPERLPSSAASSVIMPGTAQ